MTVTSKREPGAPCSECGRAVGHTFECPKNTAPPSMRSGRPAAVPGAPPDPPTQKRLCVGCAKWIDVVPDLRREGVYRCADCAPVAGSASFSEALNDWRTEIIYGCHEGDYYGGTERARAARARVESLHRDEVAELEGALAGSREALEVCVESENAMRKERDEARAERDRLAAALRGVARFGGQSPVLTANRVGDVWAPCWCDDPDEATRHDRHTAECLHARAALAALPVPDTLRGGSIVGGSVHDPAAGHIVHDDGGNDGGGA